MAGLIAQAAGQANNPSISFIVVCVFGLGMAFLDMHLPADKQLPPGGRDCIVYAWVVVGGLIGSGTTGGVLGVLVIAIGAAWSWTRSHTVALVLAIPCLAFWAGGSLAYSTDNAWANMGNMVGTPAMVYGLIELCVSGSMRIKGVDKIFDGDLDQVRFALPLFYLTL